MSHTHRALETKARSNSIIWPAVLPVAYHVIVGVAALVSRAKLGGLHLHACFVGSAALTDGCISLKIKPCSSYYLGVGRTRRRCRDYRLLNQWRGACCSIMCSMLMSVVRTNNAPTVFLRIRHAGEQLTVSAVFVNTRARVEGSGPLPRFPHNAMRRQQVWVGWCMHVWYTFCNF